MVSFDHEFLVQLFRDNAALAAELLRRSAGISVDHARVELRSIDLSQVTSTEYRADVVAILHDRSDQPVLGVIVEVQLQDDDDKRLTWPVYITALRAKFRCAVVLLVVAPHSKVAAWARQPIDIGHPGFRLAPVVIGFDDVPRVRDRKTASHLPELAVLSTMAHPEPGIAKVAIGAITGLPEDRARLYLDVIMAALPDTTWQALEAQMQRHEYRSEFARKYYGQGLEEGKKEGREAGKKEGRKEGKKEGRKEGKKEGIRAGWQGGLRAAVIAVARGKLGELSADDLTALAAVSEPATLTALATSLGKAASAAEVRAALDRALGR